MRVNRSPAASEFAEYLLRIGEAREPTVAFAEVADYIRIRDEMAFVCSPPADPARELLRHITPTSARDVATPTTWQSARSWFRETSMSTN